MHGCFCSIDTRVVRTGNNWWHQCEHNPSVQVHGVLQSDAGEPFQVSAITVEREAMESLRHGDTALIPPSRLPSDPFFYNCPTTSSDPTVVIKFYAYGVRIPYDDVAQGLQEATYLAQRHARREEIPSSVRQFKSGDLRLIVHSKGRMTWGILQTAALGIWNFVNTYEYVDFDFDVGSMEDGVKYFGTGALASVKNAAEP